MVLFVAGVRLAAFVCVRSLVVDEVVDSDLLLRRLGVVEARSKLLTTLSLRQLGRRGLNTWK